MSLALFHQGTGGRREPLPEGTAERGVPEKMQTGIKYEGGILYDTAGSTGKTGFVTAEGGGL